MHLPIAAIFAIISPTASGRPRGVSFGRHGDDGVQLSCVPDVVLWLAFRHLASTLPPSLPLFVGNLGDSVAKSSSDGDGLRIAYCITDQKLTGKVFLRTVNGASTAQKLEITLKGVGSVTGPAKLTRLHALSPADTNNIIDPKHIVPVESMIPVTATKMKHTLPGYSFKLIEVVAKK